MPAERSKHATFEKEVDAISGWPMLFIGLALMLGAVVFLFFGPGLTQLWFFPVVLLEVLVIFILTGLLKRYRPRAAVLLSSFLFALFHMNVFQFLPSFFLGVVLGLLTVRSKSLFPAMVFHFLHNSLLILGMYVVKRTPDESIPDVTTLFWGSALGLCTVLGAGTLWWLYRKPYVEVARRDG